MEKAIKIAVENGYKYHCGKSLFNSIGDGMECEFSGVNGEWAVWTRKDNGSSICVSHEEALLDKDFWQALGRGLRWALIDSDYGTFRSGTPVPKEVRWVYEWQRFVYHLAEGKDIESFFVELIPSSK